MDWVVAKGFQTVFFFSSMICYTQIEDICVMYLWVFSWCCFTCKWLLPLFFWGGRATLWCIILSGEWTSSEDSSASDPVHQEPSQVPLKRNMGISGRSRTPQTTLEIYVYRHRCNLSATKTTKWILGDWWVHLNSGDTWLMSRGWYIRGMN